MKNSQKGFLIPLVIIILALVAIGGGAYVYTKNVSKQSVEKAVVDISANNPTPTSLPSTNQPQVVTDNTKVSGVVTAPTQVIPTKKPTSTISTNSQVSTTISLGGAFKDDKGAVYHLRGPANAPITIKTWIDYAGYLGKDFDSNILKAITNHPGVVNNKVYYFPFTQIHPLDDIGVQIAECASDQGANYFWLVHSYMLTTKDWSMDTLKTYINSDTHFSGFNIANFNNCIQTGEKASISANAQNIAISEGVDGVPNSIIVNNSTGKSVTLNGWQNAYDVNIEQLAGTFKQLQLITPKGGETYHTGDKINISFSNQEKGKSYMINLITPAHITGGALPYIITGTADSVQTFQFGIPRVVVTGTYLIDLNGPYDECGAQCSDVVSQPINIVNTSQ